MSLANCILKQQRNTTTHLSEWVTSKTLTPNAVEDVEQQEQIGRAHV